jgi:hypothetical protein
MVFAMRHGVPSIGVPCVPWCKGKGSVTGISIIVPASLSDFSSFFSFSARPVKPGADLLVCFILLPFLFLLFSPLIEPGALNPQKLILSITLAYITTSIHNHFVFALTYVFILFTFFSCRWSAKKNQSN